MSTNTNLYGTNLHSNGFIILPTVSLDIPIYDDVNPTAFEDYLVYDIDGITILGGMSINEHALANPNRKILYTLDGLYAYYGMQLGFMKYSELALTNIMKDAGLKIGKELDDAAMDKYWVGNVPELYEWILSTPHNAEIVV